MKQNKKRKQTPKSVQYRLEIIFKFICMAWFENDQWRAYLLAVPCYYKKVMSLIWNIDLAKSLSCYFKIICALMPFTEIMEPWS